MARYTPGNVPSDPKLLPDFLREEFAKISQAKDTQDEWVFLKTLHVEPTKLYDGLVVKADGTDWNPGTGVGYYGYHSGVWNKLG